jgi:hypothetical protein
MNYYHPLIIPSTTLRSILDSEFENLDIPSDWTTITGFDPSIPADHWTQRLSTRRYRAARAVVVGTAPPVPIILDSGASFSISPSIEDFKQDLQLAAVTIPSRYHYKPAALGLCDSSLSFIVKCLQESSYFTDPFTRITGEDNSDCLLSSGYLDPLYPVHWNRPSSSTEEDIDATEDDFDFDISLGPIFKTIICCHLVPFTLFLFHRTLLSGSFFAFKVLLLWELLLYTVVTD